MDLSKSIQIISFDNPFPPKYGGIIDVFYKIEALHRLGYKVYLHCFVSEIVECSPELKLITEKVFFYSSSKNRFLFFSKIPYSVISRRNKDLLANIEKIDAPVLFEGLKTTYLVHSGKLLNHLKILRLHNIEQDYFKGISNSEKSLVRKLLYYFESFKFKYYENIVSKFDKVLTISRFEEGYVTKKFNNSCYVPVFHGNSFVSHLEGKGDFVLYHGDLNTSDNRKSVEFLVSVFKELPDYNLRIASGTGEKFVKDLIKKRENVFFDKLKNFDDLKCLLGQAHINVTWSFQKSGTKLKIINSLFNSRFSIINDNIIDDVVISDLCCKVESKEELILAIKKLKNRAFTDFNRRSEVLELNLNDNTNVKLIDEIITRNNEKRSAI
jgi:hypothetical protein